MTRRVLVTGSSGHLGEGLVRALSDRGTDVVGIDVLPAPFTSDVGSVADRAFVRRRLAGVDVVVHAATLHKPHIGSHSAAEFVDTNVSGTLMLLEEAVRAGVETFVFTSSTSIYGHALRPPPGEPAVWVDEDLAPVPRNIYGVTKLAAENLCRLAHQDRGLPVVVLRVSRFFMEGDDDGDLADAYPDTNIKLNEFLNRRIDLEDAVEAHLVAAGRASEIGFGCYVVSSTTPFSRDDAADLGRDAVAVVRRLVPEFEDAYRARGWTMSPRIDRVYDNSRARAELGWSPRYDYRHVLAALQRGEDMFSPLARAVGTKGYHATSVPPYTTR